MGSERTNQAQLSDTGTEMSSYISSWVFVAAIICVGCRGESDRQEASSSDAQTPLFSGFMSRQKLSEVEARLRKEGAKVAVIEDGKADTPSSKFRPPLSIQVLNVPKFTYLGFEGDLRLEFVDGELSATWFFPSAPVPFEAEMAKQWPSVASGKTVRLNDATELRANVDYRGKRYWAWEDANLRQKVERWIKENA